jgi:hypothetical protein
VRRGGDDFVDTARALFGTVVGDLKRQSNNRWKWVSVKLKETKDKSGTRYETKRRTQRRSSFGNWPSSAGNHLSLLLRT